MIFELAVIAVLLIVNVVVFVAMWWDKRKAQRGARRTREKTLLWLAVPGGIWGMLLAMRKVRHKTRDTKFKAWAFLVFLANVGVYYVVFAYVLF